MAAKPIFTREQQRLVQEAANRIWLAQFKGKPGGQAKMALALGITQQSVSNLLKGTYRPGIKVATEIAILDGKNTLEELIGVVAELEDPVPRTSKNQTAENFANLTICIQFHASSKHWSPWTIAAARAGFYGAADFAPSEWGPKLDALEKLLERGRKAS